MGDIESCTQENVGECRRTKPRIPDDWVREIDSLVLESRREKGSGFGKKHSIYKLPKGLVGHKEKRSQAYKPEVVSLGPYHHGEEQVVTMEEYKQRALRRLLVRTKKNAGDYWEALTQGEVLQQMMDSYEDLDPSWREDKERFLKLMILDGCFLLEVLRLITIFPLDEYDANDPVFAVNGLIPNMPRIRRDMLKLENQIPLLVLHKLFAVEKGLIHDKGEQRQEEYLIQELNRLVLDLLMPGINNASFVARHRPSAFHVLDLVRQRMITAVGPRRERFSRWYRRRPRDRNFDIELAASRLEDAGIQFRQSYTQSLKDITFQTGLLCGTLSLPLLLVDHATESKFLNLMAFEHLHTGLGREITAYARFMEFIIESDKDARLLSKNNIIKNRGVGTDQDIASLFNGLTRDWKSIDPRSDHLRVIVDVVNDSSNSFKGVRESLVDLRRDYFKSPWTLISLIGALVLFVLTTIQTAYAILQYNNPS